MLHTTKALRPVASSRAAGAFAAPVRPSQRVARSSIAPQAAAAPAAAASGTAEEKPKVNIVRLPPRKPEQKGPPSQEELQATAKEVLTLLSQGQPVLLSCPERTSFQINEIFLVLAAVFAQHTSTEVLVKKYVPKPDQQQGAGQAQDGKGPQGTGYFRLNVKAVANPAPASSAQVTRLVVKRDSNPVQVSFAIATELVKSSEVRISAIGPFAVKAMLEAVQRATVRVRSDNQKQLVVANVALEEVKAEKADDPRGPPKSTVLTLRLQPLAA